MCLRATLRVIVGAVLVPAALLLSWGQVAAADHIIAVALFYAPTPVTTFDGLVPEEYVSADLSVKLAAASGGRFTVVPRDRVRAQEGSLRWQEWDALRFARLQELGRAAGADTVVVGWIESLVLDRLGGGRSGFDVGGGGDGGGVLFATTVMTVQTFDASQGRIVSQTRVAGHAMGAVTAQVVQGALDDAAGRAVAQLPAALASRAP